MNAKHILGSNAFWQLNKRLVKELNDISSAVLLCYLIDKEDYHKQKEEMIILESDHGQPEEWFFATSEKIEEATTLSYKQQKRCLKILNTAGLIGQKLIGVPARLHFTISHNLICSLVTSSIAKRSKLELTKGKHSYIRTDIQEQNTKQTISENRVQSENKIKQMILEAGKGQSKKLPPEERMIQNALLKGIEFFKEYPQMIKHLMTQARIKKDDKNFVFFHELENWIRYNGDSLPIMTNTAKHIPSKFGRWLMNYKTFNKSSNTHNHEKTGTRKNKHLISAKDACDILTDLVENGI